MGGKPILPQGEEIPSCKDCGSRQTFFFYLNLSAIQNLDGKAISVFACTACSTPENLIPELAKGPLKGAAISSAYLQRYQTNFCARIFDVCEGVSVDSYEESILFKEIVLDTGGNLRVGNVLFGKIGGVPTWLLGNETPGLCDQRYKFKFLFQIFDGYRFETKFSAPRQMSLGLSGTPELCQDPYYEIFIGDAIYAFGVELKDDVLVYFLPQVQ